jgi:hypothetical protein
LPYWIVVGCCRLGGLVDEQRRKTGNMSSYANRFEVVRRQTRMVCEQTWLDGTRCGRQGEDTGEVELVALESDLKGGYSFSWFDAKGNLTRRKRMSDQDFEPISLCDGA